MKMRAAEETKDYFPRATGYVEILRCAEYDI